MNDVVFLTDLDDCIFQTIRKCPVDVPRDQLVPLGYAKDGSPLSYATPRQKDFLDWMLASGEVIPVTARSLDATRRVKFPYTRAIAANGGIMLNHEGEPDARWSSDLLEEARPHKDRLELLLRNVKHLAEVAERSVRTWIVEEQGVPCYLVVKSNDESPEAIEWLHQMGGVLRWNVPGDWTYHANDNNIAITPPHLSKARAVSKLIPLLRQEKPGCTIIGIGDSITDGPFMQQCDMAMCPPGSQIGKIMFKGAH